MSVEDRWASYLEFFQRMPQEEKERTLAGMSPGQRDHLLDLLGSRVPEVPPAPDSQLGGLPQELRLQLQEHRATAKALREVLGPEQTAEIDEVIQRLEELQVHLAVFGETNAGKSSLLNSLLGADNDDQSTWEFTVDERINAWSDEAQIKNGVRWSGVEGIDLVVYDTPGIAGDYSEHLEIAHHIISHSDIILYVVFEEIKGDAQVPVMRELMDSGKPILVVINKVDIRREAEIAAIEAGIQNKFSISNEMIVRTAGHPIQGGPDVSSLVQKISQIVSEQHFDLINQTVKDKLEKGVDDLGSLLQSRLAEDEKMAEEARRGKEHQSLSCKKAAEVLIGRYAKAAAAAAAAIPFGFDAISSTLVTGGMFYHVANEHGHKLDHKTAYKIAKELAEAFKSILFVSASTLAGYMAITKGAKTNPVTYAVGMVIDGALTFLIVSAIGNTFNHYCFNNMKWKHEEEALEVMKDYVKNNFQEMFVDKLPKRYRRRIIENMNPELVGGLDG